MISELVRKGSERFRQFQTQRELDKPAEVLRQRFFQLMDGVEEIYPLTYEPTTYVVQNSHYFVEVSCLTYYSDHWVQEKRIKVHQPTEIENYEAITVFSQTTVEPEKFGDIEISAGIIDTSLNQLVLVYPPAIVLKSKSEKRKPLASKDQIKIIMSSLTLAESAVTKRIVPENVNPITLNFVQRPLPFNPPLVFA